MYIQRQIEPVIQTAAKKFAAIFVTGPRQSGKTTLVRHMFPDHTYINLEDPITLKRVIDDPKSLLTNIKKGIIIDEIQRYPQLLSYIQVDIDNHFTPAKFILTGSQNILLSDKINQSLAGRVAIFTLLPLSLKEMSGAGLINLDPHKTDALQTLFNGFYPGKLVRNQPTNLYYSSYLQTYIERDVRTLRNIGNLVNFQRFLALLAGRVGQLLNLSNLANDVGVSPKTIGEWISILEASYVVFRLPPYHANFGKRIIKSPKIYFWDTGIAAYLLEIRSAQELTNHFALGGLFENMIIADFFKTKYHTLAAITPYFWRDKNGHEIDLLLTSADAMALFEIKSAFSYDSTFLSNLNFYRKQLQKVAQKDKKYQAILKNLKSYVIYRGPTLGEIQDHFVTNWTEIVQIQNELFATS